MRSIEVKRRILSREIAHLDSTKRSRQARYPEIDSSRFLLIWDGRNKYTNLTIGERALLNIILIVELVDDNNLKEIIASWQSAYCE